MCLKVAAFECNKSLPGLIKTFQVCSRWSPVESVEELEVSDAPAAARVLVQAGLRALNGNSIISTEPRRLTAAKVSTRAFGMGLEAIQDVAPRILDTYRLEVAYGTEHVTDGNHLTKAQAAHAPDVKFTGPSDKQCSLFMVDPDAPSPDDPKMREWLHWIVVNIPGSDVSRGFTVTPYNGPTPPRGTHRYVFLLYEQPDGVSVPQAHVQDRAKFKADKWAKEHKLGDPVAATYFTTAST